MSAPSMIEIVTVALRSRGHNDVPPDTIAAIAGAADGLQVNAAVDALEDAICDYEKVHPVHPDWHAQRRAERIAAHERKQAADAAQRNARKRNLRGAT